MAEVNFDDLVDFFEGDDRDPRQVRQRAEFEEPNSDEDQMATDMMFDVSQDAFFRSLDLPPPSAPPSPPSPSPPAPPPSPISPSIEQCLGELADLAARRPVYRRIYEAAVMRAGPVGYQPAFLPPGYGGAFDGAALSFDDEKFPTIARDYRSRMRETVPHSSLHSPVFTRPSPQSFDSTSLLHGDANNGCGPQTPFSQSWKGAADAYRDSPTNRQAMEAAISLGSWDDHLPANYPNEEECGEMADQINAVHCGKCGGLSEICGGEFFCVYHQCQNTDEWGFQCERQKNSNSQYCTGCVNGCAPWFSEPIAPGAMWASELPDAEEAPPSELATAAKEKRNIIQRRVHFNPPILSTTLAGVGSLDSSFKIPPHPWYSPVHKAIIVPPAIASDWVRPSSPLHHFPTAAAGLLWPHPPPTDMVQAAVRAKQLAEEVQQWRNYGVRLPSPSPPNSTDLNMWRNVSSGFSPSLNSNLPAPFPPRSLATPRPPPQSFDASSLLHGDANNGCGPQTPFSQKCWVVLRQNEAAAVVDGFFTNAFLIAADHFRATSTFLRNLRGVYAPDHDAVVYMNLTVQQMTGLYTTWDDLMERGEAPPLSLAPNLQSVVFIASPDIYEYIVTNKWAGHLPESIGGPPVACDSEWPRLFITEHAASLTLDDPDYAEYSTVVVAIPEGNEDYAGPNLPLLETNAQLDERIQNMDPGPPAEQPDDEDPPDAHPAVILRSLPLERLQRLHFLPIYALVGDTGLTAYRAHDNDRLASHRNPYIQIYEAYEHCASRDELDLLDAEYMWDRSTNCFSPALFVALCEAHAPASSWWRDFPVHPLGREPHPAPPITPIHRQNATVGGVQVDSSTYIRALTDVKIVEGRTLNYMSSTFRDDLTEFRTLPVAPTVTEVPTSLIKIEEGSADPLGFKLGGEYTLRNHLIPTVDPINPNNSEIQIAPEQHDPPNADNICAIRNLESQPVNNTTKEIMGIYESFRRGTAEPEQVERMLEAAHALLSMPHHSTTWANEYFVMREYALGLQADNASLAKRVREYEEQEEIRKSTRYAENDGCVIEGMDDSDEEVPGPLRATPDHPLFSRTPTP